MPDRVSETGTLTTIHLTIIAVLIVLVILAMIWGARLKRKRAAADAIEEKRLEEAGIAPPSAKDAHRPLSDADATDQPQAATPASASAEPSSATDTPETATPTPPAAPASERGSLADEPVAATSAFEASPASEAEPTPAQPAPGTADADAPVTRLKGLGPKVAAQLAELGITTVGQLAALDDVRAAELDAQLGTFKGRMARDRWIEQARLLAAGDRAGFEATFGKL